MPALELASFAPARYARRRHDIRFTHRFDPYSLRRFFIIAA
jgi:hypothetical protein